MAGLEKVMKYVKLILKIVIALIVVAVVAIQFFRIDKTNPAIVQAETLEANATVPDNVRGILERSCNDCHTNKSVYPWYSNFQPFGWFLKNHIDDGRKHLNFSQFGTLAGKRKIKKLEEVCEQLESKEMPLPSYLWIHRDAVLTDAERKTLCDWANVEKAKIVE
jgi:hypothetical protein